MVIYKWTRSNNQKLGMMFFHRSGKWRHLLQLLKRDCVQASGAFCFVKKYYGHRFIIKRFTSGLIADHNVFWINNPYNFC